MTKGRYGVRLATADDVVRLPGIERQASVRFADWLEETGLDQRALADVTSLTGFEDAQRSGHLWIAESSASDIVGFALVRPLGGHAHLDELDVLPSDGQRGVGSALLGAVCSWAADAGYPAVTLSTFRDVPWNAPFYERHGFKIVDPSDLSGDHVRLVETERLRGLHTDRRVVMAYRL